MSEGFIQAGQGAASTSPNKGEVGAERRVGVGARFARTPDVTERARKLRSNPTQAERKLWSALRGWQVDGASFRRQHPMAGYYLDFWCAEVRLAVEVDGGQHNAESGKAWDAARSRVLEDQGIEVLRFWNNDVLTNLDGVVETIRVAVQNRRGANPHPALRADLPLAGGGDPATSPSPVTGRGDRAGGDEPA